MTVLADEPVFVVEDADGLSRRSGVSAEVAVRWLLAGCSVGAAVIHFGYAPVHFIQYWLYGAFFMGVAWLQLVCAAAFVLRPSRRLLVGAVLLNTAVVGVWAASRTVGVGIGPNATVNEAVRFPDVLCSALEVLIVYGCLALLAGLGGARRWGAGPRPWRSAVRSSWSAPHRATH